LNEKLFFDDIENDRYVEIWNIVFSEFNNDGKNNYQPLARKNIDTGAGLERLACILQDVPTNYDTDQFDLAINTLTKLSKTKYDPLAYFNDNLKQKELNRIIRVIIDHLKCNMFAIADGALPSNKERGAVLRKLFRRAMVLSIRLDLKINFIKELINALIIANCEFYPYLIKEKEHIITVLESEYQLFDITLKKGLDLFNKVILKKQNKISTEDVFKLVDTYGFPYDVIVEKCREHQIIIDEKQYLLLLEKHQKISRGNLEIKGMSQQAIGLINFTTPSEFLYDKVKIANAKIIGIFNQKFEPITTSNDPC
jgi:alanyl-tRNA synthetase